MIRIGLDAMGGDYAPEATVLGAILADKHIDKESKIVLFGDKTQIQDILKREGVSEEQFEIVATTEVIQMGDHPAQSFVKKPDSSVAVGFGHLKTGKINGFASSGSTGAMLVGSMYTIKQIPGIIRPSIATLLPTADGRQAILLDVGLNIDCKPDVLYQYGKIGSIMAEAVLGVENPRVGLLNIGSEAEKGNLVSKAAFEMMNDTTEFNFVGNLEGNDIFTGGIADVIVCDGFVGNIVLKQTEGMYSILVKQGLESSFVEQLNYEVVGGTPVLGVNSTVIIGHGCSSPEAIKNMILQTERYINADLVEKFKTAFC